MIGGAIQVNFDIQHRNGSTGSLRRWKFRRRLDILASQVDATMSDVPVLIDESVLPANIFTEALASGGDIRFTTDVNGNNLANLEIEQWIPGSSLAKFWVRAPSLSSVTDTPLYLFYGRDGVSQPATGATGGSEGVWGTIVEARYDMADNTSSTILDSSSNGRNGNKTAANEPAQAGGKIANGQDFDSVDDKIDLGSFNPGAANGAISIEAWINWDGDDGSAVQMICSKSDGGDPADKLFKFYRLDDAGQNQLAFVGNAAARTFPTDIIATGTWVRITLRHTDGGTPILSQNETKYAGSDITTWGSKTTAENRIGGDETTTRGFNGLIDEVRVHNVFLSDAYIFFQYRNQNDVSNTVVLSPKYVF
jgi:hypothetical protein